MSPEYARVAVELPLAHLDRDFDYAIPETLRAAALAGARVRVSFGGRKVIGYIRELSAQTERPEKVAPLLEVLGPPVVTDYQFQLCRAVADRWIGNLSDVLRAAIPPRHARAEASVLATLPTPAELPPSLPAERLEHWRRYVGGVELLERAGTRPATARAAVLQLPGDDATKLAADLVQAAHGPSLVLVPDKRDLDRLELELLQRMDADCFIKLSAEAGPATRYRNYLRLLRGEVVIAIGTRSAVFAPIDSLKLIVMVDDGDDSFAEQHAPGWHAREVSALRANQQEAGWVGISSSRSCELAHWVATGWAVSIAASREAQRQAAPKVRATSDEDLAREPIARAARLPSAVFATLKRGLEEGPVLISVPRRGYQLHLVCAQCRQRAVCAECGGPSQRVSADAAPSCMRCGLVAARFRCRWCQHDQVRSVTVGLARTAEEIGRAFPNFKLVRSGRDQVVDQVPDEPCIVLATPGAEPTVADGHYRAAAILDAELALARTDLRAEEEAFRRWMQVSSLVQQQSGEIAVAGDARHPVIQAFVRQDPIGFAERLLQERTQAGMPPMRQLIEWLASAGSWSAAKPELPADVRVLGPAPTAEAGGERVLMLCSRASAPALARSLRALQAERSAAKAKTLLRLNVDPVQID